MAMKKKKKKKQHRFFWFMIKFQIFLMILVLAGVGYYYFGGYASQVQQMRSEAIALVDSADENTFVPGRTSSIYDTEGNLISELKGEKDAEYVNYEDIPAYFSAAMVSIEDKKFYSHNGIDIKAILRAAKAAVQNQKVSQGGSTITMQLAKLVFLDSSKTWQRKVKQMFAALELEKLYSKNQIMEFYLNNVYFANGYYGIEAACHGYFNCELSDLDLSQIAFLCAIPNSPTYYDPIENMDHTLTRRDLILKNMYEDNKIDYATYKKALAEDIALNIPEDKDDDSNVSVNTYAYYCATRALMENGGFSFKYYFDSDEEEKEYDDEYDELYDYYQKKLYSEGYKIYTSIDMDKENQLQDSVDTVLKDFKEKTDDGIYKMQSGAVSIDNETGYVVAIVGSRSQKKSSSLNRAYQSHRQPGSSIKPLIVYTPSFENGCTPNSIVKDYKFDGGPSNSGNSYYGNVSIKFAVAHSLNTVAWQLYDDLTPKVGLEYLKNMNFSAIQDDDYTLATALGGFTKGVSPLEMASAYATLENDGMYREPTCVESIVDSDENVIYTSDKTETVIYSETASRMMVDCMTEVMKSGTGRNIALDNMPCAGKTGTTNDQKDGWFCGFTRYYTTCVWVGYDTPKAVSDLTGSSYPGRIWNMYMSAIHEDLSPLDFLPYAQISDSLDEDDSQKDEKTSEKSEDKTPKVDDSDNQPDDNDDDSIDNTDDGTGDENNTDENTPSDDDTNGDDDNAVVPDDNAD